MLLASIAWVEFFKLVTVTKALHIIIVGVGSRLGFQFGFRINVLHFFSFKKGFSGKIFSVGIGTEGYLFRVSSVGQ